MSITFAYPLDLDDVPGYGSFLTYGYSSDILVTQAVINAGDPPITGYLIDPPLEGYDWSFWFEGVPTNSVVTLTVRGIQVSETSIQIRCVEE